MNKITDKQVLFALPGLHRVMRGAEVALESVAHELALLEGHEVTLIGSGESRADEPYRFLHADCSPRERFERWPKFPVLRNAYAYEELTFLRNLIRTYDPGDYDATIGCSFPFTHWALRWKQNAKEAPPHIYVTQNGDWPAQNDRSEYKYFHCDGLVCTNPDYYDRNRDRWRCKLIPNGVDPSRFTPGTADRSQFGLRDHQPVAIIISALIPSKRVAEGVAAAAKVPDLQLFVAGDGPERERVEAAGEELMPGRFQRVTVQREQMPDLYRCADLMLHMSIDEPSANAYIEALATGLPIVTHDRRVTQWTFEDTAVLVDTLDETAVTRGITDAFDAKNETDIAKRRNLVERRFSWSSIAQQYADFIDEVIHARN